MKRRPTVPVDDGSSSVSDDGDRSLSVVFHRSTSRYVHHTTSCQGSTQQFWSQP